MFKRIAGSVLLLLMAATMLYATAWAADSLHLFLHNDHDTLILGEITSVDGGRYTIAVHNTIVSGGPNKTAEQMTPERIVVDASDLDDLYFIAEKTLKKGDYLLAAFNHLDGDHFRLAHRIAYVIDTTDKETMRLILREDATIWDKMDAAAIECFVHSDGEYADFFFDGSTYEVGRYLDSGNHRSAENGEIIYRGTPDETQEPLEVVAATPTPNPSPSPTASIAQTSTPEPAPTSADFSVAIIGGSDGPTSIMVSGDPWRALIYELGAVVIVVGAVALVGLLRRKKRKNKGV